VRGSFLTNFGFQQTGIGNHLKFLFAALNSFVYLKNLFCLLEKSCYPLFLLPPFAWPIPTPDRNVLFDLVCPCHRPNRSVCRCCFIMVFINCKGLLQFRILRFFNKSGDRAQVYINRHLHIFSVEPYNPKSFHLITCPVPIVYSMQQK